MIAKQEPVPVTLFADGERDDFRWYSGDRAATDFVFFHLNGRGDLEEIRPRKIWQHDHIGGAGYSVFTWTGRNGAPLPQGEAIKIEPIPLKIATPIVAGKIRARFRHGGRHAKDIVLVLPDGRRITERDFKFHRRADHGIVIYPRAGVDGSLPGEAEIFVELSPIRTLTEGKAKALDDSAATKGKENRQKMALNVWQESPRRPLHVQCAGEIFGPKRCLDLQSGQRHWYDDGLRQKVNDWVKEFRSGNRSAFHKHSDEPVKLSTFDLGGSPAALRELLQRRDIYCLDKLAATTEVITVATGTIGASPPEIRERLEIAARGGLHPVAIQELKANEENSLTRKDASKYLISKGYQIEPKTLANLASQNRGPRFIKSNVKSVRYKCSDLDEWVRDKSLSLDIDPQEKQPDLSRHRK
jgi:hypothetical protein